MECEEDCRKSFAFRNREVLCQFQEENKMKAKDMNAKHEIYELKWEGNRDSDKYRKQCDVECREILSFFNSESL